MGPTVMLEAIVIQFDGVLYVADEHIGCDHCHLRKECKDDVDKWCNQMDILLVNTSAWRKVE